MVVLETLSMALYLARDRLNRNNLNEQLAARQVFPDIETLKVGRDGDVNVILHRHQLEMANGTKFNYWKSILGVGQPPTHFGVS